MFATSGIYASSRTDEKKVTAIYLAAVKKVVVPSQKFETQAGSASIQFLAAVGNLREVQSFAVVLP